jgi:hypothetical protein
MSLITIVHHLSSPLISIEKSHHFVNPKVKVNRQVCNDFAGISFHLNFAMRTIYSKVGTGQSL